MLTLVAPHLGGRDQVERVVQAAPRVYLCQQLSRKCVCEGWQCLSGTLPRWRSPWWTVVQAQLIMTSMLSAQLGCYCS